MQSLSAPEHHGRKEGSRHTVIQKDEEHRNQVLEEEEVAIKKAVNDAGRHRHRRKISTERRTNSRAGAEGTGWEQCEQATA